MVGVAALLKVTALTAGKGDGVVASPIGFTGLAVGGAGVTVAAAVGATAVEAATVATATGVLVSPAGFVGVGRSPRVRVAVGAACGGVGRGAAQLATSRANKIAKSGLRRIILY
jgi:hypothetical protein